jgi:4-hydroxy-tetrahydrodipicolinate reductase
MTDVGDGGVATTARCDEAPAIRVVVAGAGGKMGREAVRAIVAEPDMCVVGEVHRGDDIEAVLGASQAHVLVDLTVPDAVMRNVRAALALGIVPVVGTTGLTQADLAEIRARCAEQGVGALVAPNFAIGAVLLMRFAQEAARYLPDVEIIEMHHDGKRDAPSGTALKTAELIVGARDADRIRGGATGAFESVPGVRGGRTEGGVPVHSVRLPGYVASQEVIFGGPGQRLTLRHDSIDRVSFMPGVILAIRRARSLTGLVYGLENLL